MVRLFQTHQIRKYRELSGQLWDFSILSEGEKDNTSKLFVPGCWENVPGFENYRGKAVYRKKIQASGNIRLEFKGVSHYAAVSVDGTKIAEHYNSYTSFSGIARELKPGEHMIEVVVDNSYQEKYSLNTPNDYMSYGGITRGVILEEIGEVYIKRISFTPLKIESGWKGVAEIVIMNIGNSRQEVSIEAELLEHLSEEHTVLEPEESKKITLDLQCDEAETWCPEHPVLYELKAVVYQSGKPVDDFIDRVGFRTVSIEKNRILLNGRPLFIKGFCRHEDHPQFGCALPLEAMLYDLQMVKDMGANSIRTTHYPNDERFLDLCDEMGILVWEENHARALTEEKMRNPYFEPQAEQVIEEMILQHYNHPSIYIWGILNECASDTETGRECYEKQYQRIRKYDGSRPCSSASCRHKTDICMDLPDVVSWNIYPYWYVDKTATEMTDELYQWNQIDGHGRGKPFLITEIGAGAIYGYRNREHDKWTEEYQAEALEKQLTELFSFSECSGFYIWQFCDNKISSEWFHTRPRTKNNKGIVDEYRRPKMAYDVVKRIFSRHSDYLKI